MAGGPRSGIPRAKMAQKASGEGGGGEEYRGRRINFPSVTPTDRPKFVGRIFLSFCAFVYLGVHAAFFLAFSFQEFS